ncbi:MAG TPA: hypothetical protein VH000_08190 [Rhizomicrobium sp.]|jgi:hypothetical protein|nr:hypothetical protein [Rhizomicrobium sp.]
MKTAIIAGLMFLGSTIAAQADTDIYNDMTNSGRGGEALHAAAGYCAQRWGDPQNGEETSPGFKQCMIGQGWVFQLTQRTAAEARADAEAAQEAQQQADDDDQAEMNQMWEEQRDDEQRRNDEATQDLVNQENAFAEEEAQQAQQQVIDAQNMANAIAAAQ